MGTKQIFAKSAAALLLIATANAEAFTMPSKKALAPKAAAQNCDTGVRQNSFKDLVHMVNVFSKSGVDPRQEANPTTDFKGRFSPIGMITNITKVPSPHLADIDTATGKAKDGNFRSTAFLVSECHVLTNYHAAFGSAAEPSEKYISSFETVDENGKPRKGIRAKPVAWGSFNKSSQVRDDWALLELSVCEGKRLGYLDLGTKQPVDLMKSNLMMAGFPGDKSTSKIWADTKCTVAEYGANGQPGALFHDCASREGASGSPIFVFEDKKLKVVGLHQGDYNPAEGVVNEFSMDRANKAIDIREILPSIQKYLPTKVASAKTPLATGPTRLADGSGKMVKTQN